MVIFDANFLLLLLDPEVDVPADPKTGQPLSQAKDRVDYLIAQLSEQRETIGLPTPVIAEVLVHAERAGPSYLAIIGDSSRFRVLSFDLRAPVDVAAMTASAIAGGDKKAGSTAPWQKVKFDRKIIAIAKVEQVTALYTDDSDLVCMAKAVGLHTVCSSELPLPPDPSQGTLKF